MGKYNHINKLTGAENYFQWRHQMMLALQGKRLLLHCSDGTDQKDVGIGNHACSLVVTGQTKSLTCAWRMSISFLAYFLHHRYIVQAHHPPAYLICYLLLCLDLPRSSYPLLLSIQYSHI